MSSSNTTQDLVSRPPLNPEYFQTLNPERFDKFRLYDSLSSLVSDDDDCNWRYQLMIIDQNITSAGSSRGGVSRSNISLPCAVFLIPAGRESEYLFSSRRGLLNIAKSAKCARLIAVAFQRNYHTAATTLATNETTTTPQSHDYQSQEHVQTELTNTVQLIAQSGTFLLSDNDNHPNTDFQIPFMALDNGIGTRNVIFRGNTITTGDYVVEEVLVENEQWVRRLYFMQNPNVIQSEVYMKHSTDKEEGETQALEVDPFTLAFDYHKEIVAGYILLAGGGASSTSIDSDKTNANKKHAMVIGLGGGGFVNFFLQAFGRTLERLFVVELDPGVISIAKSHFGFCQEGDTLSNSITEAIAGDGLLVRPSSTHNDTDTDQNSTTSFSPGSMSFILIDVDSKDVTKGMSCPPESFIEVSYLSNLKMLLKENEGILAINISARDPDMFQLVKRNVCRVFRNDNGDAVFVSKSNQDDEEEEEEEDEPEDLNVVIFAKRGKKNTTMESSAAAAATTSIQLPKGMDLVECIEKACDDLQIESVDFRGELEECALGIKSVVPSTTQNTKKKMTGKNKKKKGGGKNKKGKRK